MDRNTLHVTADGGRIQVADGAQDTGGTASARRLARHAWIVRAAAVTFLAGGGIVSYLFFSAV